MYDVVIIGCGIIGAATAYELSKYNLKIAVLEKDIDIANVTTKANSAIIHAGYDTQPGTLMAKLNVQGCSMIEEISQKLSVPYKKCGSLVIAFSDEDLAAIQTLYQRGLENQVPGLQILTAQQALEMEPNLSQQVKGALYAPSAAIVSPWELCIAMADTAKLNGVDFFLESEVVSIDHTEDRYILHTANAFFESKYVVNAAGLQSEQVGSMVGKPNFTVIPDKGQYYLLDKSQGGLVARVIFQCPTKVGKGVLVAPTVHGNLIVGPDAVEIHNPLDVSNTQPSLDYVRQTALLSIPSIHFRDSIRNFAGVRCTSDHNDFIIEEAKDAKGFINLAGIKSPGLSAAPAIALECIRLLENSGMSLEKKDCYTDTRNIVRFKELSYEEKAALVKKNPLYGRVICRCETITEGEIVDAIRSPITPRTIDSIKRRCGAGMGRCQGGFCGPRVHEIIARELRLPMQDIVLNKAEAFIITGETKCGGGSTMKKYDLVVVGGGPAGLAAAYEGYRGGAKSVLILERDRELGGILNQCIHNGFGLHYFQKELTGPEYAERFIKMLADTKVKVKLDTMVLEVTPNKMIHCVNSVDGYMMIQAKAIVLAMGCRERTRGAIAIPGDRPAGIFTAGTAQRYVNMEGYMVGKRIIILGSGDIGLIMARRMTLEGAKVLACIELMPYSNGLNRNIVQCLHDYNIPLYLSHTIIDIKGSSRVEQVTVAKVDENKKPIPGTEIVFDCDTILLSVGLVPENELSRSVGLEIDPCTNGPMVYENMETSIEGIFACGNVVHVHDLVDFVTAESQRAGRAAIEYIKRGERVSQSLIKINRGDCIHCIVPQKIRCDRVEKAAEIFFRVDNVYQDVAVKVEYEGGVLAQFKREHMAPGEMEKISIPTILLNKITGTQITVSVSKE